MTGYLVVQRRLNDRSPNRPAATFFAQAGAADRILWSDRVGELIIATSGVVATLRPAADATGAERFADVAAQRSQLVESVLVESDGDPQPVRLLGGFAFESGDDPAWSGFGSGWLVLPELCVTESHGEIWTAAAVAIESVRTPSEWSAIDLDAARLVLNERLDAVEAQLRPVDDAAASSSLDGCKTSENTPLSAEWSNDDAYVELVRRAVADIRSGQLDKVVLARESTIDASIDVVSLLDELQRRHPACTVFAFSVGDRTFLGATPERLVALDRDGLRTSAVAGTAPRGLDPDDDRRLGNELLASAKDRSEHEFVVSAVRERLGQIGVVCEAPADPVVMKLASLQHLHTPIRGRVPSAGEGADADDRAVVDVVRVAGALHPTPAVAGTPTEGARGWIAEHEPFGRGWYAAPVGWCDLDGRGEFNVGLRSALVTSTEVRLYAGAGIVSDSDPTKELVETAVKLDAVGAAVVAAHGGASVDSPATAANQVASAA